MNDHTLRETLADLTLDLIGVESVTGNEAAIAAFVAQWFREKVPADWVDVVGNSVMVRPTPLSVPTVGLFGHLDTVPGREDQPPRRDHEYVYGTGSSDMKGALAVKMVLAAEMAGTDPSRWLRRPLFVFYDAEEGPYLESGLIPLEAARGEVLREMEFAICMEPTSNTIQMGCTGTLHATLTFTGKRAHTARPWQGENAMHKAGPLLSELLAREPIDIQYGDLLFREVMSVTVASGPTARNVVPDHFSLNLNYRFSPAKSLEEAQQDVMELVAGRAEVTFTDLCPSGEPCLDNPHFKALHALTLAAIEPKQAWTDVARIQTWGIDAINYGPGDGAEAHQRNEKAPIGPLVTTYRELERFFLGNSERA